MERSCPLSILKSPPRRLSTTPPSMPGAHTRGPPRILRRWSFSSSPPISVVSTMVVYMSGQMASP